MARRPLPKQNTRKGPAIGARDIRLAQIAPSSYDAGARTVEATLSTGASVMRWFGEELLVISPEAVDLSRVALGQVKILDSHNAYSIDALCGSLVSARIEGGSLVGLIQFAESDKGRAAEAAVAAGDLTGISIGYAVSAWEEVERAGQCDLYRASRWQLLEASFVTVPADPFASVRSLGDTQYRAVTTEGAVKEKGRAAGSEGAAEEDDAEDGIEDRGTEDDDQSDEDVVGNEPDEDDEPEEAPENDDDDPEAARAADERSAQPGANRAAPSNPKDKTTMKTLTVSEALEIGRQADALGLDRTAVDVELAKPDITPEAARKFVLDQAATTQSTRSAFSGARVLRDEVETQGEAITDYLHSRMTGIAPTEKGRMLQGMRLIDVMGQRMGIKSRNPAEILQRASMTTGDFPNLLEQAANKTLLGAYQVAVPTYKKWVKIVRFNDFKVHKFYRVGDFPALLPITETGDVPGASFSENREQVTPVTRGAIIPLSRQMLINDDLNAFADLVMGAGMEAARTENALAYAVLTANSGAGPALSDTFNLFSTQHANYAGTGTAITIAALAAGRAAMRKQKGVGGTQPLNLSPTILLVGPDKETEAQQLVAPIQAQQAGNVNPFSGLLEVVSDAQMIANNGGLSWNLFASPLVAPTVVGGYLQDSNGPQITQFMPATVDGIQLRVLHDFGVGAVDYRGAYRNLGA